MSKSRTSIGAVRSAETTDAVLTAAAEILDEHGYAGFTLDAVVKRAGSSKPTIYRWWANKSALIRDVYERSGEEPLKIPDTGNLQDDLTAHLTDLWRWWRSSRSGEVFRSLLTEIQLHPESIEGFRKDFMHRRSRILRSVIGAAIEREEPLDDKKVEAAIRLLTGFSWLHLLTANLHDEETIASAAAIVARGLESS